MLPASMFFWIYLIIYVVKLPDGQSFIDDWNISSWILIISNSFQPNSLFYNFYKEYKNKSNKQI